MSYLIMFFAVSSAMMFLPITAYAERADIQIYAGSFDSIPIAVIPFAAGDNKKIDHDEPWKVIAEDLDFCGRFRVQSLDTIDSSAMNAGTILLAINGSYSIVDDTVQIECRLSDAATGSMVMGRRYTGPLRESRRMGHRFANTVYEFLYSESGFFETSIIFIRDSGEVKSVFMMDYDGRSLKQLTSSKTINIFPCFAGPSSYTWVSYLKGNPDIFTCDIGTNSPKLFLGTKKTETSPDYSSIESRLVYASSISGNLDIYAAYLAGDGTKRLTFGQAVETSPCWSPDGYHIAFVSDRTGRPQIYIMDNEGANLRRLNAPGSHQDSPAWSPKGDLIAYTALGGGTYNIWVVAPDGTGARQVTFNPGSNEYPSWSPNGSHIAFHSTNNGKSEIYAVRPDGTGLRRITGLGNARMPCWSQFPPAAAE
jgi:TolB protein